jgi:2-polyprenyl-6-methoxyphenol hydroxylase-like FAD-dependent oxidoreductase
MPDVLILGGGIVGAAAAMMLARDGREVTVLERDPAPPPASIEEAAENWDRPGVAQFRQAHYMHTRFRHVLDEELPDVRDALVENGARRYATATAFLPPTLGDRSPRDGDERYDALTGRRQMLEAVFAAKAEDEAGVKVVRGAKVEALLADAESIAGVPNVVGVRTASGEEIRADVVVDAMGRGSKVAAWLQAMGARPPYEEAEANGFMYYARFFRGERLPDQSGRGQIEFGSYSILTLPSDNDTWWVLLWGETGDGPLKALRNADVWSKVVRAIPAKAHWIDAEAITGVMAMSGILDRYRRFVVDGKPVVTGLFSVGDAWACTNPSLGRGLSLGLAHAQRLRRLLRSAGGDPSATALQWDDVTERDLTPWYRTQVEMDRVRVASMAADREGREPPAEAESYGMFARAVRHDADCYRAFLEVMGCLRTPGELFADRTLFDTMIAASARETPPPQGPTRTELLEILSS